MTERLPPASYRIADDDPQYGWEAQAAPFPQTGPPDEITFGEVTRPCYQLRAPVPPSVYPLVVIATTVVDYGAHYDPAGRIDAICFWFRERTYEADGSLLTVRGTGLLAVRPDRRHLGIGLRLAQAVYEGPWESRPVVAQAYTIPGRGLAERFRQEIGET